MSDKSAPTLEEQRLGTLERESEDEDVQWLLDLLGQRDAKVRTLTEENKTKAAALTELHAAVRDHLKNRFRRDTARWLKDLVDAQRAEGTVGD